MTYEQGAPSTSPPILAVTGERLTAFQWLNSPFKARQLSYGNGLMNDLSRTTDSDAILGNELFTGKRLYLDFGGKRFAIVGER